MLRRIMTLCIVLAISIACAPSFPAADAAAAKTAAATAEADNPKLKKDSYYILKRTAVVLTAAKKAAKKSGKCRGLGLAVVHQRYARLWYLTGKYRSSIYHTLRCRELAVLVLKQNNAPLPAECLLTALEKSYAKQAPSPDKLDKELSKRDLIKDKDGINSIIEDSIP
ncbi:MAG: hypothetical protein ACM3X6_10590 [Patescibacteria group bacterium]